MVYTATVTLKVDFLKVFAYVNVYSELEGALAFKAQVESEPGNENVMCIVAQSVLREGEVK